VGALYQLHVVYVAKEAVDRVCFFGGMIASELQPGDERNLNKHLILKITVGR
jgi:hypothetical protein